MYLSKPATVVFDPSKKEHRAAARAYLKRKAWVDCPLRFAHDPAYGSVASQIESKLLGWYVQQEEARENRRAAAQLMKKGAEACKTLGDSIRLAQAEGRFPPDGWMPSAPFKLHDFGQRGKTAAGEPVLTTIGVGTAR
jgi:hypothetical protein